MSKITLNGSVRSLACPTCGSGRSRVRDSRTADSTLLGTRRRRECIECATRFTTYEIIGDDHRAVELVERARRDALLNRLHILRTAVDELMKELASVP